MLHARVGTAIYLHGSPASRAMRVLAAGAPACLTVTHLDGFVLARSAFHHSVNYRSVVVLGRAVTVTEPAEKLAALEAFMERVTPGRWAEVRPPDARELKATAVLRMDLGAASAKIGPVAPTTTRAISGDRPGRGSSRSTWWPARRISPPISPRGSRRLRPSGPCWNAMGRSAATDGGAPGMRAVEAAGRCGGERRPVRRVSRVRRALAGARRGEARSWRRSSGSGRREPRSRR